MPDLKVLGIICVLVFFAGLVDAVAGGGGLIALPAYLAAGLPYHNALGCTKFSSGLGSLTASIRYIKSKKVEFKTAIPSMITALLGSFLGANLSMLVPDEYMRIFVIVATPIVAIFVLIKKDLGAENNSDTIPQRKKMILALIIGLIMGLYDGFFGPGTGTFLMLGYALLLKFDLVSASGNAKLINLASNMAALCAFALEGKVLFQFAIPAAVFGIAGNYIGSGLAIKNGPKIVRPILIVVLVILIVRIIWS